MTEYRNPVPVVVGIVCPEREKLIIVRRAIEPFKGDWALPGGYVNLGEDWRVALAREIDEETMIEVDVDSISPYDVRSTPDGSKILIFGLVKKIIRVKEFTPTEETSEIRYASFGRYVSPSLSLCFPLHMEVVKRYAETRPWPREHA